jgi:hypothetical protein
VLGFLEPDYVILERSEIHFMPVHPLRIYVFDVDRNRSVDVFPPKKDVFREQYSRMIWPHISRDWCRVNNAECDPGNFDTGIKEPLTVNQSASVFGFEAAYDANGFGAEVRKHVQPRSVAYIFRRRGEEWDYRALEPGQIPSRFGVPGIRELVTRNPYAAFQR